MWRRVGLVFLLLAGLLILDSLSGKSEDSPSEILGMLVMFSFAAAILAAIVAISKWLAQLWAKKPEK